MGDQTESRVTEIIDPIEIEKYRQQYPRKYIVFNEPIVIESSTCCFEKVGSRIYSAKAQPGVNWIEISDFIPVDHQLFPQMILGEDINYQLTYNKKQSSHTIEVNGLRKVFRKVNTKFYLCELYHSDYITDDWFKPYQGSRLSTFLASFDCSASVIPQVKRYLEHHYRAHMFDMLPQGPLYRFTVTLQQYREAFCYFRELFRGQKITFLLTTTSYSEIDYYYDWRIRIYLCQLFPQELGQLIDSYL